MMRATTAIDVHHRGDVHIVRFGQTDILYPDSIHRVREEIGSLVKEGGPVKVVLDLADAQLVSSEAIGMIVVLNNVITPAGGQLHLANISEHTMEVLEVIRLQNVLKIFPSTELAIAAFR